MKTVIAGGGIAGLISALSLSLHKDQEVILIEKADHPGGLLKSFDYGEQGLFDHGAHNVCETGNTAIDKVIFDLLPKGGWDVLEKDKRDLAGIFYDGRLQLNTPYIDIRHKDQYKQYIADFFANIESTPSYNGPQNAYETISQKFGESITQEVISPVVNKIYKKDIQDLDLLSILLTPLTRVNMFSSFLMEDLLHTKHLKNLLSFPEQRELPLQHSSGRRSLYPKNFGMQKVVDAIVKKLQENNVKILTNTGIKKITTQNQKISEVTIENAEGNIEQISLDYFVWSVGIPQLSFMLGLVNGKPDFDPPLKTIVTNLIVEKPIAMGDLYYLYCYDDGYHTFRVSNYDNYCSTAKRSNGYPISIELLMEPTQVESPEKITEIAISELRKMQILQEDNQVNFGKTEILASGFPMPTLKNSLFINQKRKEIEKLDLQNLVLTGILSEPNLFFQTDIIRDTYEKMLDRIIQK